MSRRHQPGKPQAGNPQAVGHLHQFPKMAGVEPGQGGVEADLQSGRQQGADPLQGGVKAAGSPDVFMNLPGPSRLIWTP